MKHYVTEVGRDVANHLFARLLRPQRRLYCSRSGLLEVVATVHRRCNAGLISQSAFNVAYHQFLADRRAMRFEPVRNYQIDAAFRHILTHNLNATDALHLQCALEIYSRLQPQGDSLLFFSADQRLLRAAQAEGLRVFNPETGTVAELDNLLVELLHKP